MVASTFHCSLWPVASQIHRHKPRLSLDAVLEVLLLCFRSLCLCQCAVYMRSVCGASCVCAAAFALSFHRHRFNMKWIGYFAGRSVVRTICTYDDISPFLMCLLFLFTVPISSTHCFHSCSIFLFVPSFHFSGCVWERVRGFGHRAISP